MSDYVFHSEHSVMVASTTTKQSKTVEYIEEYIDELVERGEHSRVMILSGCHGMETGEDGMNSLDCLSDSVIRGKSQTRGFYEDWLQWFKLSVEGEDPRVYDPETGEVTGIKESVEKPEWAKRIPGHVPDFFKGMKAKMSDIVFQIVDIAFYHGKPDELIADIEKFSLSTLHQGEFSLVASIKVKFLASVTKTVVVSF